MSENVFQKFARWLASFFGATEGGGTREAQRYLDFEAPRFTPIDIDHEAERLNLRRKAREAAREDLPPSESTALDANQELVTSFINDLCAELREGCEKRAARLKKIFIQAQEKIEQLHRETPQLGSKLEEKLDTLRQQSEIRIAHTRDEERKLGNEYWEFKEHHGLHNREPEIPESRVFLMSAIIGILVLEALVNATFFERGSEGGLLQGMFTAFLLAAIDVGIVSFLGRGGSWHVSRTLFHRVMAATCWLVFVAWAVGYNLLVSHVREALQMHPEDYWAAALKTFTQHPLGLEQADSWILMVVGLAFSIGAMFSGYNWTEKYPGYASIHRRYELRREETQHEIRSFQDEAERLRNEANSQLDKNTVELRHQLGAMRDVAEAEEVLLRRAKEYISVLPGSCRALLAIYQSENSRYRKISAPAYFQEHYDMELADNFAGHAAQYEEAMQESTHRMNDIHEKTEPIRNEIRATYENFRTNANALLGLKN